MSVRGSDEVVEPNARRARRGVSMHFLAAGAVLGIWTSRLPAVKDTLHLSDGEVAVVLFSSAVGAVLALRIAGRVTERFGSRQVTGVAGTSLMAGLVLIAIAPNLATLAAAMLLLMGIASLQDVGMNSQAIAVEQRLRRPVMSSFHAVFSIGGIVGAALGALAAATDVSYRWTYVVMAALLASWVLFANRLLLNAPETSQRARSEMEGSRTLPHRKTLFVLGAIGFACFIGEGAAADWTTIYLRDGTGSSAAVAAVGFMLFNVTMTVGRLSGDRLAARYGPLPLIRFATAVAGVGFAAGLFFRTTFAGMVGFAVLGLGLSVVVPQVFSAAGQLAPGRAPAALSLVSSISYTGFLAGPAALGAVAHVTDLRTALFIPVALILASTVIASRLQSAMASDVRNTA